jgi:hypothetical protein
MKEKPILFSGSMVKAILDGTKTQTRRLVKHQPITGDVHKTKDDGVWSVQSERNVTSYFGCPYGKPGDRLWVKETFAPSFEPGPRNPNHKPGFTYRADWALEDDGESRDFAWKPSIFCSRKASRINLEIVSVRVERLQEISEHDAQAEGCHLECMTPTGDDNGSAIHGPGGYIALWESINGPGSWEANPWVLAIEFKRVEEPS